MAQANPTTELDTPEFLHEFLPYPIDVPTPGDLKHNPFETLQNANNISERDISELLIAAVNEHNLVPRSRLSEYKAFFNSCTDEKPPTTSAAIFHPRDVPEGALPLGVDQVVSVEFRSHRRGIDPFDNKFAGGPQKARKRLFDGLSSVSELVYATQQRVFCFMLLVIGRSFRLLRWDRAGVTTTPSIDYFEHPGTLYDILWRLSHLDDVALGLDPSATRLRSADVDFLHMDFAALPNPTDVSHSERQLEDNELQPPFVFEYVRSIFRTSLQSDWPRHKVQVPDGSRTREYLIGKPEFRAGDMIGRGTRGYVALDCKTGRFVWLKDAWRASYVLSETEGDMLRRLNEARVENVPTLVCHGDISDQATVTGDVWERQHPLPSTTPTHCSPSPSSSTTLTSSSPGSKKRKREDVAPGSTLFYRPNATTKSNCPLRQHKHYRIVVEEVCMPLKNFQYGRQLLMVVLDCLRAHHQAATKPTPQLLHRDISGGNILIYPKVKRDKDGKKPLMVWSGLLSDWELAKPINTVEAASKATQEDRMGTYQYMSVNLLNHITDPVKISDELESFFHVLIYYSVRYLRSNCSCIESWIDNYFHTYLGPGRTGACGQKSYTLEVTGELRVWMNGDPLAFRSPMDTVLTIILKSLRQRYRIMYYDAAQAAAPPPEPEPEPKERDPPVVAAAPPDPLFAGVDPAKLAEWEAQWEAGPYVDLGPTEEERKLAARLDCHEFMLAYLARQVENPYWRRDDRIPKAEAEPSPSEVKDAKVAAPPSKGNKRQRTGEHNASLPARLHASTRRTPRHRPRTHPVRARR